MEFSRPPIGATLGCAVYFASMAVLLGAVIVGSWGLWLAIFR